jgi:glucose-6-phosphate 1-epimerase
LSDSITSTLNAQFRTPGLVFDSGPSGQPRLTINTEQAECEIYLHGAQVTHWRPRGFHPVLWLSEQAVFAPDKAIRGGIPVCWPWFGPHPSDPAAKAHGIARTRMWSLTHAALGADGVAEATLTLPCDAETRALWPHAFELTLTVRAGRALHVALTTHNTSNTPLTLSEALHTYLAVGDVRAIHIDGLDGAAYLDQTRANLTQTQHGLMTFGAETDRIYATQAACELIDPSMNRRLRIDKTGSASSVIWNPWLAKAARLGDVDPAAWPGFVCIEAANCGAASVTIAPDGVHTLATQISVDWLGAPGVSA